MEPIHPQVLVVADEIRLVGTLPDAAPFAELGTRELKGVPGTWELYRVE
jgi:hypothetical protein